VTVGDPGRATDPLEQTTSALAAGARLDRDTMTRLYRRVAPSVLAWATLRLTPALRRVLDVEDVVQEVWFRALAGLAGYDPSRASFRTWVFGIANHVVLNGYRLLRKNATGATDRDLREIPDDVTSISRALVRDETLARCVSALAGLAGDERLLLIHCGLEGMPVAEAAGILGISTDAAAKRWQRLRARLRETAPFTDLIAP
jgi:RNA polymerase sigma factor (sigma-70 family)